MHFSAAGILFEKQEKISLKTRWMNSHEELKGKLVKVTIFLLDFNYEGNEERHVLIFSLNSHHEAKVIYLNLPLI